MRRKDQDASTSSQQSAVADAGIKALIPIGQRPFLDYVLSGLTDAGFRDACLVVGPEHDALRDYYAGQGKPSRIGVHFSIQAQPLGTADAVLAAQVFAGGDEFAVLNSDNYYSQAALHALQRLGQSGTVLFEEDSLIRDSNIPAERISAFAYGVVDNDQYLAALVEKPDEATAAAMRGRALVSMNLWRFSPAIFDFCRTVGPSIRGELELTSAIMNAIHGGMKLRVARCADGVLDLSQRADIAQVAERLKNVQVSP